MVHVRARIVTMRTLPINAKFPFICGIIHLYSVSANEAIALERERVQPARLSVRSLCVRASSEGAFPEESNRHSQERPSRKLLRPVRSRKETSAVEEGERSKGA